MTRVNKRILIMAGGTGGHIFPGLAVADELLHSGVEVAWLGTDAGLESRLVPEKGYQLFKIDIQGLRGKGLRGWLLAPFKILHALIQANKVLKTFAPCAVLSMGGYVAGPGGLAARLRGIPLLIHEQNRVPGMTNKILSRWAAKVFQGFPGSFPETIKAITVGNPVREAIANTQAPSERLAQRQGPIRMLVLGGSQGAVAINHLLPEALKKLPAKDDVVIKHQAGRGRSAETRELYTARPEQIEVCEFIQDMAAAYRWADLVICRAGALTVAEIAAVGLAAIFIPFPAAVDDHQTKNAEYLASAGAARILPQAEVNADRLAMVITRMISERENLVTMAALARTKALPDAAATVARYCQEMCV